MVDIHMQKKKHRKKKNIDLHLTLHTKMNSKWIIGVDVIPKIINL